MKPIALIILDGFGLAPPGPGNAVYLANTPVFDGLWERYPHTQLEASGPAVGLPEGQMGNSEVGHLNLGAGRVVMQKQTYIQSLIDDGRFFENDVLRHACHAFEQGKALHLMGLVSDGGVHSDLRHFYALLDLTQQFDNPQVYIHAFTDGRDVGPTTGKGFLAQLDARTRQMKGVKIATVSGRYYAMDRDKRWPRIKLAYDALVSGQAEFTAQSGAEAVQAAYQRGETDEFIKPTVLLSKNEGEGEGEGSPSTSSPSTGSGSGTAHPVATIQDGDAIFFFNFRADRARQLTYALLNAEFDGFQRSRVLKQLNYASMMKYSDDIHAPFAFQLPKIKSGLAEVLSKAGKTQYHSAETEKYPHVTFFFNATREEPFPGESRTLTPSPKVATYDLQPQMSAPELTAAAVERIQNHNDDFILINFANPDMVGHTGIIPAAVAACQASDKGLGQLLNALRQKGARAIIVADHGNCEVMIDHKGGPHTAHTTNPVPCILVDDHYPGTLRHNGKLGDIAPTILQLMHIPPPEMTGESLLLPES
ncbi:MAG: 2,3-bisphosphoglycerate-independent phosphoglycerate mutase [Ardenticatenaceae bacterium]